MINVACGMPSSSASTTPVCPAPRSSDCKPVRIRSGDSAFAASASRAATPSVSRAASDSAPSSAVTMWIARSAPLASASRIVLAARSGPAHSTMTSPAPSRSFNCNASSSAYASGSLMVHAASPSSILRPSAATRTCASRSGTCLIATRIFIGTPSFAFETRTLKSIATRREKVSGAHALRVAQLRLTIASVDFSNKKKADAERLVSAGKVDDDDVVELKLRPKRLAEFIGQEKAKEQLAIALAAAKARGEALDHVLLFGPPGLGKTTLATIIANELGVGYQQTSGPALQIQGDLTAILTNLREKQVLFLDEIHRLQPVLEEKLYTALEDYQMDIIIGQGPSARTHTLEIKPFTFVAATTRPGLLSSPLRSRFGILLRLEFYTDDELRYVVERSAEVLGVPIDRDGAAEIAMRSR